MDGPIVFIRKILNVSKRKKIVAKMQQRLTNKDFSLFSTNCIGGVICHDMGVRFNSPTVNLWLDFCDFVKLMENLEHYMSIIPYEIETKEKYPVLQLDDIRLNCVHYRSAKIAIKKWVERAKRVNYDNICIVLQGYPEYLVCRKDFDKLPYKKLCFMTNEPMEKKPFMVMATDRLGKRGVNLFNFRNLKGERYYDRYIDFVEFFNEMKK